MNTIMTLIVSQYSSFQVHSFNCFVHLAIKKSWLQVKKLNVEVRRRREGETISESRWGMNKDKSMYNAIDNMHSCVIHMQDWRMKWVMNRRIRIGLKLSSLLICTLIQCPLTFVVHFFCYFFLFFPLKWRNNVKK